MNIGENRCFTQTFYTSLIDYPLSIGSEVELRCGISEIQNGGIFLLPFENWLYEYRVQWSVCLQIL